MQPVAFKNIGIIGDEFKNIPKYLDSLAQVIEERWYLTQGTRDLPECVGSVGAFNISVTKNPFPEIRKNTEFLGWISYMIVDSSSESKYTPLSNPDLKEQNSPLWVSSLNSAAKALGLEAFIDFVNAVPNMGVSSASPGNMGPSIILLHAAAQLYH